MKTLIEKRKELVKKSGVWYDKSKNKMSVIFRIYSEIEKQDKEFIDDILEGIEKNIKYHQKHFNRYSQECVKATKDGDLSQLKYSEFSAIKEMYINDELKEIRKMIKQKAGETNKMKKYKALIEIEEEIVRMMRMDFGIHNSVAWSIVKKIREISRIKLEKQKDERIR